MINEEEVKIIEKNIKETAKELGLELTNNLPKIARAKAMMFGVEEWHRCPCSSGNKERYCGSKLCEAEARVNVCHCNLMFEDK